MVSVRLVFAISASKQYEVYHMDMKSSLLYGYLHEEICTNHPEGYILEPTLVCRLRKSFYVLKQAPRAWYEKMDSFLLAQNFVRCKYDSNVYLHQYEDNLLIIVLYVDYLLITGSTLASVSFIIIFVSLKQR